MNATDDFFDTGLRLRGFQVWARAPHHYRRYFTLFLRHPEVFPTEAYRGPDFLDKPAWYVGFTRPDGERQWIYGSYKTFEEAEHARQTYSGAREAQLGCQFEVWDEPQVDHGGRCGVTWTNENTWAALKFEITPEEVVPILAWRKEAEKPAREQTQAIEEAKEVALMLAERVPSDSRKEDWLPFVTAALRHFHFTQNEAMDADAIARSFTVANQQIEYGRDFKRLTGREFDAATDRITREEAESYPLTPSRSYEIQERDYECLECGAVYPPEKAHLIDDGGMGCARCNH